MKASSHATVCSVLVAALMLMLLSAELAMGAVSCSPTQLSPCVGAITSDKPPSALCCTKIKEQKPCLCQYMKNPTLKKFINTPNARKVASSCGTPFPRC